MPPPPNNTEADGIGPTSASVDVKNPNHPPKEDGENGGMDGAAAKTTTAGGASVSREPSPPQQQSQPPQPPQITNKNNNETLKRLASYMPASACVEPKNLRILICCASKQCMNEWLEILQDCQYGHVVAVKTSKQAMEKLTMPNGNFDLILKEHEPPHTNACRMLRKIWKDKTLRSIPVIVVSRRHDSKIIQECLQHGAADYLIKPLRHNEAKTIWIRVWTRKLALHFDPFRRPSVPKPIAPGGSPAAGAGSPSAESGFTTDSELDGDSREGSNPNDHAEKEYRMQQTNGNGSGSGSGSGADMFGAKNTAYDKEQREKARVAEELKNPQVDSGNNPFANATTVNGIGNVVAHSAFQAFLSPHQHGGKKGASPPNGRAEGRGEHHGSNGNGSNGSGPHSNGQGSNGQGSNRQGSNGDGSGNGSNGNGASSMPTQAAERENKRHKPSLEASLNGQTATANTTLNAPGSVLNGAENATIAAAAAANAGMTLTPFGPMPSSMAQQVMWGIAAQQVMGWGNALAQQAVGGMSSQGTQAAQAAAHAHAAAAAHALGRAPSNGAHGALSAQPPPSTSTGGTAATDVEPPTHATSAERRAAALDKFRLKRKSLNYSKKIRYASRKQLAEARPRVKGQFVKTSSTSNKEDK